MHWGIYYRSIFFFFRNSGWGTVRLSSIKFASILDMIVLNSFSIMFGINFIERHNAVCYFFFGKSRWGTVRLSSIKWASFFIWLCLAPFTLYLVLISFRHSFRLFNSFCFIFGINVIEASMTVSFFFFEVEGVLFDFGR